MDFEIGKKDDLIGIIKLNEQLNNGNPYSLNENEIQNLWESIENNGIRYFLAKTNGKIIGSLYICIIINLTYNKKSIGYIENVIVDENYRKKGIGKKLMEMAIEYAKEKNCYKVVLQSGMKRTEAHKFYENIGFNGESKKAFELRF